MPFLELFDETLDINSTENYELALQLSPESISFCILDSIRNKFVLLRSSEPDENKYYNPEEIHEMLSKDDFLGKKYKKVNLVFPSPKFTLVPAPLFDPGKKDDYYYFNHNKEDGRNIVTNKLTDPDTFIVFSESTHILNIASQFFPEAFPYHHLKPLFSFISGNRKNVSGNYIHLHVEREYFNMIIFNNNLLQFCNTYTYRNISDILYFVLNVFRNLDIKQEETIWLSGLTEKYDDLSSNLSIYIRNIKFAEPSGNFTFSYVFNETDLHRYLNLFSASNCE
jgi:hypothetical protein